MKKIITLLAICFLAVANVKAQYVTIPDANFRTFLETKYPSAFNAAHEMDTANSLIVSETNLDCSFKSIASLDGIQYFDGLLGLNCRGNLLTSIPRLPSVMSTLDCSNNPNLSCISRVPNSPSPYLYPCYLDITNTNIQCLPNYGNNIFVENGTPILTPLCNATNNPNNCNVYPNNYSVLAPSFGNNLFSSKKIPSCVIKVDQQLGSIFLLDTTCTDLLSIDTLIISAANINSFKGLQYFKNLKYFDCFGNDFDSLLYLPSQLEYLNCAACGNLISLPTLPPNLKYLNCRDAGLQSLPTLPNALKYLDVHCPLVSLPALPNSLKFLDCSASFLSQLQNRFITSLPALPASLDTLDISIQKIGSLPILPSSLKYLDCNFNLQLNCLPYLPNSLKRLRVQSTNITCLPNIVNGLTIDSDSTVMPICNTTNNPNNCPVYPANYVNIPDSNFRNFLETNFPSAFNGAHQMDTSNSLIINQTTIDCGNPYAFGITDLTGIEYFKKLKYLKVFGNPIVTYPLLTDSIENLDIKGTKIIYIPSLPKNLKFFYLEGVQIDSLPTLPKNLEELIAGDEISWILGITPYYKSLKITSLPTLPSTLKYLMLDALDLSSLPSLPSGLLQLGIRTKKVNFISSFPSSLNYLHISKAPIQCLPLLPNGLQILNIDDSTNIKCIPNLPVGCIFGNGIIYPICNPSNNVNQCQAFPTVKGRVFTDNNSNGIKDANEFYRPFVKELASNGDADFTNLDGTFSFSFDSIGSHSLKTIAPKYFKAVPDSNSFGFVSYSDDIALPDIALQPILSIDSLAILLVGPNRARPGFNFHYEIDYQNLGTTKLSTTTSFTYDTSRLIYDSSSVAIISHTNNNIIVSSDSLVGGQAKYISLYFTVKQTAIIGDSLFAVANATSGVTTATSSKATIIRGSYDPNDKTATPQLTPTQIANGDWIEYTIRFQNTGNDTAITVALADTLSSLLQPEYFSVIATSHPSNVTHKANSNIVYFEFLNINLPDSATNYNGSQGWVTFKVKPLPSVTAGTYIDNTASIYFDYNQPVQTNVARTLISSTPLPVKLLSYELRLINEVTRNEKQVMNLWSTTNEINASHFNIQRSIDGVNFKTVGKVAAKGSSSYSFADPLTISNLSSTIFYRLQIVDKDGRIEYSPIKEISFNSLANKQIKIYPNPAKDMVTIECANAKQIRIVNQLGILVEQFKSVAERQTIKTKPFAKGVYMVQIVLDNGNIANEKLIVE